MRSTSYARKPRPPVANSPIAANEIASRPPVVPPDTLSAAGQADLARVLAEAQGVFPGVRLVEIRPIAPQRADIEVPTLAPVPVDDGASCPVDTDRDRIGAPTPAPPERPQRIPKRWGRIRRPPRTGHSPVRHWFRHRQLAAAAPRTPAADRSGAAADGHRHVPELWLPPPAAHPPGWGRSGTASGACTSGPLGTSVIGAKARRAPPSYLRKRNSSRSPPSGRNGPPCAPFPPALVIPWAAAETPSAGQPEGS
jgi:hypothetical protein